MQVKQKVQAPVLVPKIESPLAMNHLFVGKVIIILPHLSMNHLFVGKVIIILPHPHP